MIIYRSEPLVLMVRLSLSAICLVELMESAGVIWFGGFYKV